MLEFTLCEPQRTNAQPDNHTRSRKPAQAGGGWSKLRYRREREAAHEDPELTVNHEEVTSLHGHNAAFQAVDRTLRQLAQVKVRSNKIKKSLINTKGAALHDDFMSTSAARSKTRRFPSDHSLEQVVVALVVRNTKELALHDDPTPIDTYRWAYGQCTGTQNLQVVQSTSSPQLGHSFGPRVRCARRAQHQRG